MIIMNTQSIAKERTAYKTAGTEDSVGENNKKNKRWLKNLSEALYMELREHKSSFIVYFTLRLLVIVMMVLQLMNRNYENVFLCVLTLMLLVIPSLVQVTFKVELPTVLEIIILIFIFAAEILGEISEFYLLFPFWDTVLHTINGFLAAAIGFSMTIGVIWEFFEFGMDQIAGFDMQKDTVIHTIRSVNLDPAGRNVPYVIDGITSTAVNGAELGLGGYLDIGLIDTMQDLIVNFIGASIFSVIGFFFVKNRGRGKVAKRFIPRRKSEDRDFLKIVMEEKEAEEGAEAETAEEKKNAENREETGEQ